MTTDTITLRELTIRYAAKTDITGQLIQVGARLSSPQAAATVFTAVLQDEPVEVFGLICLSTKRHVLAYHEVSRGTLSGTLAHPREVFQAALLANASAIIVAHNHPSGDVDPSSDDIQLTRRLVQAGTLLGVDVLDHLIVGAGRWYSFQQAGLVLV